MKTSALKRGLIAFAAGLCLSVLGLSPAAAQPDAAVVKQQEQVSKKTIEQMRNALPNAAMAKDKQADVGVCYTCHKDVKAFHVSSKHQSVNCATCHNNFEDHVAKDGKAYVVVVMVEHGGGGSSVAGPVAKKVYDQLFGPDPNAPAAPVVQAPPSSTERAD